MDSVETGRAVSAASSAAESFGLVVDEAIVLNDSNRLVVRLLPCDVVARIVPAGYRVFAAAMGAEREMEVLHLLASADAPLAAPEPRVQPRVFARDGFEIELLTYYEVSAGALPPDDYADALGRLHRAMRDVPVEAPHFTERIADVQQWLASPQATPDLADEEREYLGSTLTRLREAVIDRRAPEQLLHGEPHPWNVLDTNDGPLFVDFENGVRGPVEWDLGWVPASVSDRYASADRDLVDTCRGLVLTIVAAHCWRPEDERPGARSRGAFMKAVRAGPPWVALDAV